MTAPGLDQWHDLGRKALHPLQRLLEGDPGAADDHGEHHVADAHLLVAFDVVRDLRWRAREGTQLFSPLNSTAWRSRLGLIHYHRG